MFVVVTDDPEESDDSTAKHSESLSLHCRTGILDFQFIFSLLHLFWLFMHGFY